MRSVKSRPDAERDPAVEVATRLQALRYRFREVLDRAANARRDRSALRPDQTYVSNAADKIVEDDDLRMRELIGKRDLRKKADAHAGKNPGPDCLDAIGRQIPVNAHAEGTIGPDKRPLRRLPQAT
jgi:hypothetical protein